MENKDRELSYGDSSNYKGYVIGIDEENIENPNEILINIYKSLKERGLEYLLKILQVNPNTKLKIPLRDNDTEEFEKMTKKMNVENQVELLQINNDEKKLAELFEQADYIFFAPQKRVVKEVPNSLIDGIVRGKPVIISDVIDFYKEVDKFNIGVVVKKGDSPIKLNMSKAEYEEYSMEKFAEKYICLFEKKRKKGLI